MSIILCIYINISTFPTLILIHTNPKEKIVDTFNQLSLKGDFFYKKRKKKEKDIKEFVITQL